jgi:hypothetical protein
MFRKLILSAVLAIGTLTALTATASTADAAPNGVRRYERGHRGGDRDRHYHRWHGDRHWRR